MNDRNRRGVEHPPLVSRTLERGAARQNAEAEQSRGTTQAMRETRASLRGEGDRPREDETAGERTPRPEPHPEAPHKAHGDALQDGSGTRHGVREREERPRTEEPPRT